MFKKILIVYSEKLSEKHLKTVEKVREILKNENTHVIRANEIDDIYFNDVDLVLTIGGDGTFIRAATLVKDAIIMGINSEPEFSEGGLTSIKEDELDFINEILKGKFKTTEKDRIKVKINGKELKEIVLNEVYVGAEHQYHTSRYIIKTKEKQEEQRSSGVLIATGSGSHAWYKSAGGAPFTSDSKKLRFLVREPFLGNLFKPKMLNGEIKQGDKIEFISKRHAEQVIALDSNKLYPFNNNSVAEIELSENPLRVIVK